MRLPIIHIVFLLSYADALTPSRFLLPNHAVQPMSDETQTNDAEHMANHGHPPSAEDAKQHFPQSFSSPFQVVGQSGVPAMAAALMPNGNVVFVDKVENYTQLVLDNGQYAYSAEYNLTTNTAYGLSLNTNPFCSGGAFLADGRLVSIGGNGPLAEIDPTVGDGFQGIRYLERGVYHEDWYEPGHSLSTPRWYASVQMLQDKRLFVASGSLNGMDPMQSENNNPTFEILGADGGSVLLPLSKENEWEPEIVICGGGAYADIASPADRTCGRIKPLSESPEWYMEEMPEPRVMVEGILLPDGKVLWLNGARRGAQGFGTAQEPCFGALIYDPEQPSGNRWSHEGTSNIPRLYHSVALLLLDGTIMIAGSNPVEQPLLEPDYSSPETSYVTEFRVEVYTPPYLSGANASKRPQDIRLSQTNLTSDDDEPFNISFTSNTNSTDLKIALYHGGFITHSLHMGQRLLFLDHEGFTPGVEEQVVKVYMPASSSIAPAGPYVIYVVLDGVPGLGQFVVVS
ncbi:hypothetical protein F66182_14896 [Fusarium sp. NRRL 66182]|nr:hypothetical protein F66182_14896 [Fusarium sp. NRRL 66182]